MAVQTIWSWLVTAAKDGYWWTEYGSRISHATTARVWHVRKETWIQTRPIDSASL
jgi:hypothetical protein